MHKVLWRSFLGLVRVGVAWVPALTLAAWGTAYVRTCWLTALAPGTGVTYRYESGTGIATLSADSYVADVMGGRYLLRGVKLARPDGAVAAKVDEVILKMSGPAIHVRLKGATVTVERGKDGAVDFKGLLPKPTGEKDESRVELEADELVVDYRDLTASPPITRRVPLHGLSVAHAAGETLAWVDAQGVAQVAAWVKADGDWSADVRLSGGDLAWLTAPARSWMPAPTDPKYADWRVDKLTGAGKLSVDSHAGKIAVSGDAELHASGATVGRTLVGAAIDAEIHGDLGQAKVKASSREANRSLSFDGSLVMGPKLSVSGTFSATVRSQADVWPELAKAMPAGLKFSKAAYSGSVYMADGVPNVVGDVTAEMVAASGLELDKVAATLGVNGSQVAVQAQSLRLMGTDWKGRIDVDTKTGQIKGFADTNDDLAKLWPDAKGYDLHLPGSARVIVNGTTDHLEAVVDGQAKVGWTPTGRPSAELGDLVARASLKGDIVTIDRCLVRGQAGSAKLEGSADLRKKTLRLEASIAGFRLSPFSDKVDGTVASHLSISGPFDKWSMAGRVEGYGLEVAGVSIPQAIAEITGNAEAVDINELRVRLLGGRATAKGTLHIADQVLAVDFNAQDLDVARLSEHAVVGQVDLLNGHLSGTLSQPQMTVQATSVGIVAGSVKLAQVEAGLSLMGEQVLVSGAIAQIGGGHVAAEGNLDLATMESALHGTWEGVKLDSLVPAALNLAMEGKTSGQFTVLDPGTGSPGTTAHVEIDGLALSHLDVGSGTLDLGFSDGHVTGTGTVGSISRFVQLVGLDYDVEANKIFATADVAEFGLRQAVRAAVAQSESPDLDMARLVDQLDGSVSAHVVIDGDVASPTVRVPQLSVRDLTVSARPMGDVLASGTIQGEAWTLENLNWHKQEAHVIAQARATTAHDLTGRLEVVGLEMADVAAFIPGIDISQGTASASVVFSGKADAPEARGSAKIDKLLLQDGTGKPVNIPLSVNAAELTWREGVLAGSGDFLVATQQIQGGVTGAFALRLPTKGWGLDKDRAVGVDVALDNRPLASLAGLWPEIEENGTVGTVAAEIHVVGKPGDVQVGGNARITADDKGQSSLKLKSVSQPLKGLMAEILFGGKDAEVKASATGPFGGSALLNAKIDASAAFNQAFSIENLMAGSMVDARLAFDNLVWKGRLAGADKDSGLTLKGDLTAKGRVDEPSVGGRLELSKVTLNAAPVAPTSSTVAKPVIDPVFENLTVVTDHGSQVNIGTASVDLFGTGTLSGTLSDPRFLAELGLDGGSLRLPTNRITLEDDGRIRVLAEGFPPVMRVDVNLTGKTVATARQTADQYQTYVINLDIKGNLLGEEPLQINGTSDPPDLSNEQIKAILGERQLIESLAQGALGRGSSQDLRDSFYSVAVPTLTQGLTENLAKSVGLDYLLLDYNPLDQAVFRAGKTIGKGLMLQGVRQLSEPTFGRTKYEISLSYRPPFKDRFFSRVRFTLGQTQDVAWKIGVGWSIRF